MKKPKPTPVRERLLKLMKPETFYFPENAAKAINSSPIAAEASLMALEREGIVKGELRIHTANYGAGRLRYKRAYALKPKAAA